MEWVLLATLGSPVIFSNSKFLALGVRAQLVFWFLSFLSAGIASLTALVMAAVVSFDLWIRMNTQPMGSTPWGQALGVSFLPWLFLAIGGIGIALVTGRIEPQISQARSTQTLLAMSQTPLEVFHGTPVVILEIPIPVAFTTSIRTVKTIVISRFIYQGLQRDALEAVLWHEIGHIRGRHNMLRQIASFAVTVAPFIRASQLFQLEIERLCELEADEFALGKCPEVALLEARQRFSF